MFDNILNKIKNLFSRQSNNSDPILELEALTDLTKDEILSKAGYTKYKSGINGKIPQKDKSELK
jgi:hypothetical protein